MNISIRTFLLTLLLGLPLLLGLYTYLYSIKTGVQRITDETRAEIHRTLTHSSDTLRYFLSDQNPSQVQHEVSKLGENTNIRHALLFNENKDITASIHIANRGQSLRQVLLPALGSEAVAFEKNLHGQADTEHVTIWTSVDGNSLYGISPIHYSSKKSSVRPDQTSFLFIQQDLSHDIQASNSLAINIIIVQFLLSLLVIYLVNQVVITRFNALRNLATDFLSKNNLENDKNTNNEISLFDNTLSHLMKELGDASSKLKEQSQFTLNIINSTDEGILGLNSQGRITFVNQAGIKMLGYQHETELLGKNMHRLILHSYRNGEAYPAANSPITNSIQSYTKVHCETDVFWRADHQYIEVEYWISPLHANQTNTGAVVTFMDITERRRAQYDLLIKDAAITNSMNAIAMADMEGHIFYVNDAMIKMWGYDSAAEILGKSAITFWQEPGQAAEIIQTLLKQEKVTTEMQAMRKDGSVFCAHLSANISNDQFGKPLCLQASFLDITEQKETEAALLRSEETYAKAEEIAHIGSWDWNILTGDLHWTDEIYRIFGQRPQSFGATYEAFTQTIHPEDRELVSSAVGAAVADANTRYSIEHRVVRPDGEIRIVHERGKVYRDETGEPVRMIGTVHDITERKAFEKAIRDERNFVNAILDSAGALVTVLDNLGRVVRYNRTCQETTGFSYEEIIGDYIWKKLLPAEMADVVQQMFLTPETIPSEYTNAWLTKDGGSRLIEWSNRPLLNEHGKVQYVVSLGIDITDKDAAERELEKHRKQLELLVDERTEELRLAQDELVRKERLATLGQLTATVSHELRNPLGAMRPSIYLIKKIAGGEDQKLNNAIERIERNISRCDHIIDELLDFTRITELDEIPVKLDGWLNEIVLEHDIPESIQLQTSFGLADTSVYIDPERLRRCIVNLVDNAIQAMTEESYQAKHPLALSISTIAEEHRINIHIQDSGPGIEPEIINRIFEPLFSTKGFGVGLGLPTVKQIMQQHQGGIEVTSSPEQGTTMTLWLPKDRMEK